MGPPRIARVRCRIAAEAEGNAAAVHGQQPLADGLRRGHALAQGEGVLDARQLLDEAPAGGDDQRVVCTSPASVSTTRPPSLSPVTRPAMNSTPWSLEEAAQGAGSGRPLRKPLGIQIRLGR
jgi:hypothetical protein